MRPVGDRLAETHPVAAILLYREMADTVLRRGQSPQYDHAVRDLVAAERLDANAFEQSDDSGGAIGYAEAIGDGERARAAVAALRCGEVILTRSFIRLQRNGRCHNHLAVTSAFGQREGEKGVGHTLGQWQATGILTGERAGAQPGAHYAGIDQVRAHPRFGDFTSIDLDQHFEPGLAYRVRAPIRED